MFDLIFAFFHLFLLLGALGYAVYSLLLGNTYRFVLILVCLGVYYFLVLHKALMKEIQRKKNKKSNPPA